MLKTKREWIEWFNSLDDDTQIRIIIACSIEKEENGKVKKVVIEAC